MRYNLLRYDFRNAGQRSRVTQNLLALRDQLNSEVPDRDSDNHILLATWNIRDFGKRNRLGFGKRLKESHYYIAEIISRFDFVAVQEVNDLPEWERVMDILGPDWDFISTDVTDRALGGNGERLTYAFDKRKVWFQNVAGEIVLPAKMLISQSIVEDGRQSLTAGKQFRRTPFLARFQRGWFKFDICTVHIYYGAESGDKLKERVEEIDRIASYLGKRAKEASKEGRALILLGDFNIVHPEHQTMKALTNQGFRIPQTLKRPTNINRSKYYDQIAFYARDEVLEFIDKTSRRKKDRNAGIVEIFDSVYTDKLSNDYIGGMQQSKNGKGKSANELKKYYKDWRTYQLSDHKLMWVRLQVNDSDRYLRRLIEEG